MKQFVIIPAFLFVCGSLNAQQLKEAEVPKAVKDAQQQNFPGSRVTKWEKEGSNYEAEFIVQKVETSADFDGNGTMLSTETEIKVSELPQNITDYFTKNKPGKKIKEASRIILTTGDLNYEAEVEGVDYIFDTNGNLLKTESDMGKDDDKK
jgi:hypothetical protein